jgi:hypothetical protein
VSTPSISRESRGAEAPLLHRIKDELGWADFQVRSDTAIRRHQTLVACAFTFCWATRPADTRPQPPTDTGARDIADSDTEERGASAAATGHTAGLAARAARRARLADPGDRAHALVAGLVDGAPTG